MLITLLAVCTFKIHLLNRTKITEGWATVILKLDFISLGDVSITRRLPLLKLHTKPNTEY